MGETILMNHDYTHCADYDAAICPKSCFRAQVTAELEADRENIVGVPISWASFKGTKECRLTNPEPKRTNAERILQMLPDEKQKLFNSIIADETGIQFHFCGKRHFVGYDALVNFLSKEDDE